MRLSSSTILRMVPLPRWGRQENDKPKFENNKHFFPKALDNQVTVCYNDYNEYA